MGDILGTSLAAIRANRLRSVLTILIIAVGIMSLVGIQTALEVIGRELDSSFGRMGASALTISQADDGPPVTFAQAGSLCKEICGGTAGMSAIVSPIAQVRSDNEVSDPAVTIIAADDKWLECSGNHISEGRNFSSSETSGHTSVCLIGNTLCRKLFPEGGAVGESISTGSGRYRIVGTISKRGAAFGQGSDYSLVIPAGCQGSVRDGYSVTILPGAGYDPESAGRLMRRIRRLEPGADDDFTIRGCDMVEEMLGAISGKLSSGALVIGIITLLGAAVGLMNIMLVSVKERRSEIGLRKAVGASNRSIALQFLAEAALISLTGGIIGITAGVLGGNITALIMDGAFSMPWKWIAVALALSAATGLLSGWIPAHRAAALNPVNSLQHE